MQQNFAASLAIILGYEGGRVDDPQDPGGRTNEGVTQATFNAWLARHGSQHRDVFSITPDEVAAIYRSDFWDAVRGDNLPSGVDLAVFDFAVNSGVSRAAIYLQEIAGVAPDGKIGPLTLAAVDRQPSDFLITKLCAMRLGFLKKLSGWPRFGAGWSTRVHNVQDRAIVMSKASPA